MPVLVEGCDIILGNEEDAEKHFGLHPEGVDVTAGHSLDAKSYWFCFETIDGNVSPGSKGHYHFKRIY